MKKRTSNFIWLIYEQEYKSGIYIIDYKNNISTWMDQNKRVIFINKTVGTI